MQADFPFIGRWMEGYSLLAEITSGLEFHILWEKLQSRKSA